MCRGRHRTCVVLGSDPSLWPTRAPIMPPDWVDPQLTIFEKAVDLAAVGDATGARSQLEQVESRKLQEWFIEHGQMSGTVRDAYFNRVVPAVPIADRDLLRSPQRFAKAVFARDGYRCRYCGVRLVPAEVLKGFGRAVGSDTFATAGTNLQRHGVALAFRAIADHVTPWTRGGRTDMENLVSACWSCNYGKADFTVDQIGLEDPRSRPIGTPDGWDGLTSRLAPLRTYGQAAAASLS